MLAAYATCDDYPHNAFLAQFFFISQTNKLDTSELHCKIAGSAAMSSIREGDTNTGIEEQQGSKKRRCGPDAQTLPREPTITINAPPKSYVVQHTERNTVCIGGCMFPLPEVERIQLGSLKFLQDEMETNAQMPVTFETLVSSKSTPELTPTDADVLIRVEAIDICIQAYQAAYNTSAVKHCQTIQRDVIRYANEICQRRQDNHDRTEIMDMLHQRMRNYANMMAVDTIATKLRDPCCVLTLHDHTQRDECLKTLKKMKRLLREHNKSMQRFLCD